MDARELTKRYYVMENIVIDLQKKCEYLEHVIDKLLMRMGDTEFVIKELCTERGIR